MKTPDTTIRKAIYDAVKTITFNSATVNVFSGMPENPSYPYILISNQSSSETRNKDPYFFDHDVIIEIVTGFAGGTGSKGPADEISDDVTQAIVNIAGDSTFKIEDVRLDFTDYLYGDTGRFKIIRKILRFSFKVQQLT